MSTVVKRGQCGHYGREKIDIYDLSKAIPYHQKDLLIDMLNQKHVAQVTCIFRVTISFYISPVLFKSPLKDSCGESICLFYLMHSISHPSVISTKCWNC